jgi:hypothetical protein
MPTRTTASHHRLAEGNFKASYAAEGSTAVHQLMMDDYAESVESQPLHAWVLLGKLPAVLPPAPAASTPAAADGPLALRGPAGALTEPPAPLAASGPSSNTPAKQPDSTLAVTAGASAKPKGKGIDLSVFIPTQLADLQVLIAQKLQGDHQ